MDQRTWRSACRHHALLTGGTPLLFGLTQRILEGIQNAQGDTRKAIHGSIMRLVDRRIERWHERSSGAVESKRFTKAISRAEGTPLVFRQDVSGNITVSIEIDGSIIRPGSILLPITLPQTTVAGLIGKPIATVIDDATGLVDTDRIITSHHERNGWKRRSCLVTTSEPEVEAAYRDLIDDPESRYDVGDHLALCA